MFGLKNKPAPPSRGQYNKVSTNAGKRTTNWNFQKWVQANLMYIKVGSLLILVTAVALGVTGGLGLFTSSSSTDSNVFSSSTGLDNPIRSSSSVIQSSPSSTASSSSTRSSSSSSSSTQSSSSSSSSTQSSSSSSSSSVVQNNSPTLYTAQRSTGFTKTPASFRGLSNTEGLKPKMGWGTYGGFQASFTQSTITTNVDNLVSGGYLSAGYRYIQVGEGYQQPNRNSSGFIQTTVSFTNGMSYLSNYIHSVGMKFSIYTMLNTVEDQARFQFAHTVTAQNVIDDANLFLSWNVDAIQVDAQPAVVPNSNSNSIGFPALLDRMIAGSVPLNVKCSWPYYLIISTGWDGIPWSDIYRICSVERVIGDVTGNWASVSGGLTAFTNIFQYIENLQGPGNFMDADWIQCGNSITDNQCRAQLSLFAIWSSPLLISTTINTISATSAGYLKNTEMIAINQDNMCNIGVPIAPGVYFKPLASGDFAIAIYNSASTTLNFVSSFEDLGLPLFAYGVRDVWSQTNLGYYYGTFSATVDPTSTNLYRFVPVPSNLATPLVSTGLSQLTVEKFNAPLITNYNELASSMAVTQNGNTISSTGVRFDSHRKDAIVNYKLNTPSKFKSFNLTFEMNPQYFPTSGELDANIILAYDTDFGAITWGIKVSPSSGGACTGINRFYMFFEQNSFANANTYLCTNAEMTLSTYSNVRVEVSKSKRLLNIFINEVLVGSRNLNGYIITRMRTTTITDICLGCTRAANMFIRNVRLNQIVAE